MNKNKFSEIIPCNLFIESLPVLAYIISKDGYLKSWNSKAWNEFGYYDEELQDLFVLDIIDKNDHQKVIDGLKNALEGGVILIEHNALLKNGERVPLIANASSFEIDGEKYIIGVSTLIGELTEARDKIKEQLKEINRLNELLVAKNIYLKEKIKSIGSYGDIIGESESLKYTLYKAEQVAGTDAPVLIEGETGTGKELIARMIHNNSKRNEEMFVRVNCASIPETLIESELFGHTAGSFTGAIENRKGRFEVAEGGTLFLDEIGELPLPIQSKLLHVLQDGGYEKVGSSKTKKANVRIIAATNRILNSEVKKGRFRKDLFYRINVFPITVSPLRQRKEDILHLTQFFVKKYSERFNIPIEIISEETITKLKSYNWPGNVRELENIIERGVISSKNKVLRIEKLKNELDTENSNILPLHEYEKNYILKILERTNWKISGTGGAAELLEINHQTLRSKIKKLGIKRSTV